MRKVLNILFSFLFYFIFQNIFEIIIMSLLLKVGVSYMGLETRGESLIEVIIGIAVLYTYSKLLYSASIYIVIALGSTLYIFRNKIVGYKNIATVHIFVSLLTFLTLWFCLDNNLKYITNPLLALLLSGGLIYIITLKFNKK